MKHVIIGTAGHVDHGKTSLVKALTGIDTDRLYEEQRRGVTIELGFAYIDFEDGLRAGLIDVPGHERFIRNMLSGAGGIDLALLAVAADEGVMPQTREHLGILIQLGVGDGLVAVTMLDKVEPDWLELVLDDISRLTEGTFLEGKPVIPVSSHTGEGLSELRQALRDLVEAADEKDSSLPFRLPADRVFPAPGFGTVVTGTLIAGTVSPGDTVEILPMQKKATVRSVQVHGESVDVAYAGQRTAISLSGLKQGDVRRGDVLAALNTLNVTNMVDVRLSVFRDSRRTIRSGADLHMYHGARTLLARAVLLGIEELPGGESCYARLKLGQPLPCKRGDRFVVRFYSPIETIGGGVILDSAPVKKLSQLRASLKALEIRESGLSVQIADLAAVELNSVFTESDIRRRTDLAEEACRDAIQSLTDNGRILQLLPGKGISADAIASLGQKCVRLLESYHDRYPLRAAMNTAELRQKLLPGADPADAGAVLQLLDNNGVIRLSETGAALPDHRANLTAQQRAIRDKLLKALSAAGCDTPSPEELVSLFQKNERNDFGQVLESLTSGGELVVLSQQVLWSGEVFEGAVSKLRVHFEKNDEITLAQCRDLLGTSRKYALAFLEYLDGKRVTRKVGDSRKLDRGFDRLTLEIDNH